MSTISTSLGDSAIMLRRNFKHQGRNPSAVFQAVLLPIVIMGMFVLVFGGAFDVGGGKYIDYAVPGLTVMAITYGLGPTAMSVHGDMAKGIINRFKVMDVSRGAVLTGHVVATTMRCLLACVAIVGVGFAMGFRSDAGVLGWLGAFGMVALISFAASWLTVAMGLAAKTPESAGMGSVPLNILPFLSSAFVPADSMGDGVRQFAEYQPFTPMIETLRGLMTGHTPSTGHVIGAFAWSIGLTALGYVWAVSTFKKRA
ncbi:ABC transporter permease [Streptomyces sp. TLI_185]|uniref:ABC transporter permease n=1 Tax=Streptomyces sp. TLI_185 TaxID=2485151 RepID=UPI000F4ED8A3|nr:ABC transporter permease [Streptomyces sp. TLI_185]RPF24833.1 ABC-2 type transport system permease protein [Streptomyces sp. TLI_185]